MYEEYIGIVLCTSRHVVTSFFTIDFKLKQVFYESRINHLDENVEHYHETLEKWN